MLRPSWIRTALPAGAGFERVNRLLSRRGLNTVCTNARCPNLADCWGRGTATFMILGDTCTRACRFCSVTTGNPSGAVDETEPERVAAAVAELRLRYVVLTSVDRDDLPDLGAGTFAATIKACRPGPVAHAPQVEVLTPDFGGRENLIAVVLAARPDVFGHNIETVERLSPAVRDPRASYRRSLAVLEAAKRLSPGTATKCGLMVGLGETDGEVGQTMKDLRSAGCDIITIGQYLQPSRECLAVARYVEPGTFARWRDQALGLGFRAAFCGPMVRSSYHAAEVFPR